MAKYSTLPNYELQRPEIHVQFNSSGIFETQDEAEIEFLDECAPFIERIDKPQKLDKSKQKSK
jgi:hypothetical protein